MRENWDGKYSVSDRLRTGLRTTRYFSKLVAAVHVVELHVFRFTYF